MNKKDLKQTIRELTNHILNSGDLIEEPLQQVENLIKKYPEELEGFKAMFNNEKFKANRDVLALIIIQHEANEDVIKFLQTEEGWQVDDFEGTAAEKYTKDQ